MFTRCLTDDEKYACMHVETSKQCPQTELDGGLHRVHSADEALTDWQNTARDGQNKN